MTHRPVGAGSSFAFAVGTATTSSSFSVQSSVLRVIAVGASAHISVGTNPSATRSDYYVSSGEAVTLALTKASNRVVGITTGAMTTVIFPEGTQCPFGVGDYVTLSVSGQSYYDFNHAQVSAVDTTSGVNGYHQTRMTLIYDSSGISTAFSSSYATASISNKVSAFGIGSGTIYYQQVQITGDA
jgi:hypothetical protein